MRDYFHAALDGSLVPVSLMPLADIRDVLSRDIETNGTPHESIRERLRIELLIRELDL